MPWPLEKFKKQCERLAASGAGGAGGQQQLAALLLAEPICPATEGHRRMLLKAKSRLEHTGYAVAGAWLPVSSGSAFRGEGLPALSVSFRLHLAQIVARQDDVSAAAPWDPAADDKRPEYVQMLATLAAELNAALPASMGGRHLSVFLVVGSDNRSCFKALSAEEGQGLVTVPLKGFDVGLEKPTKKIFVTEPAAGRVDGTSSSRLLEALRNGDTAYVREVLPPEAARLLLEPSSFDRSSFGGDLELLAAAAPDRLWPSRKLADRLLAAPPAEGQVCALLVCSGSLGPVHLGHLQAIKAAKARLEEAGYLVLAAWLSVSGDKAAWRDFKAKGAPELHSAFRVKAAELAVCDDPVISVGTWETAKDAEVKPRELAQALQETVRSSFQYSLEGSVLKTFYVCGCDVASRFSLEKGFQAHAELGVVIVPRGGEEGEAGHFLESPHQRLFVCEALPGEAGLLSSSKLRQSIKSGVASAAARAMPLAAARFVLAPTSAEHAEMAEDFERLGVKLPAQSELAAMQQSLKSTLKTWAGPGGCISAKEMSRLLRVLDPSWTAQELEELMSQSSSVVEGKVDSEGFVDWIFGGGQLAA